MPGTRRNQDRITGGNLPSFTLDFHLAGAHSDKVKLLTQLVIMTFRCRTWGQGSFGQTLVLNRGIRLVQNATNRGPILGREGSLG